MKLNQDRLGRHLPVHTERLRVLYIGRSDRNAMCGEEALALGPHRSRGIQSLKFDTDEIPNLPLKRGSQDVVDAPPGNGDLRHHVQLVAGLVPRQQVQAIQKHLIAFSKSMRADNDRRRWLSILNGAGANRDFRKALSYFDALALEKWTGLLFRCLRPIDLGLSIVTEQLGDLRHRTQRLSAMRMYSGETSIPTDLRPSMRATRIVVPVPQKGSSTTPAGGQVASMGILQRSSGYGA